MSFIFIYGRPGSGKTTLAASMTKLGYIVNIIDIDQKADKMINLRKQVDERKVIPFNIDEKLSNISMKERILTPSKALNSQPKGYLKICDFIDIYEKEIIEGITKFNEVLVIDSLTSFIEHIKRLISYITKKEKFSFDEWNMLLVNLEDFFYTMMRMQKLFKHVIIIAHEQVEKDEDSGRIISILPAIEGSMRNKVSKYFEEVYRTQVIVKQGKAEYKVATIPMNNAEARTSHNLEALAEADFSILFKEEKNVLHSC
jgi:hypothetical protein